jgi:ATP-dependent DNA ligase
LADTGGTRPVSRQLRTASHRRSSAGTSSPSWSHGSTRTRAATDLSARRIAEIIAKLPTWAAYLDGQTTVLGDDGVTSFAALQDALSRHQAEALAYFVFDLLYLDGRDLRPLPLVERKQALAKLLANLPKGGPVR